ncbi:hypothetical protein [Mucilaginibacter pedocola]|uniref:hypothetical protein n=1 Tax=Mucilaginibacter pedocola TaxID=1792845 RepID=UPI0011816A9B|nr:hypothetical protein [Mucilaginibacter pedocola]
MLTHDFQRLLISVFFLAMTALVAYGFYCNRKSKSYIGTGRVADMEAWNIKETMTWITTFGLSVVAIINYI